MARPITTVSLVANTYCMMDGLSSHAPRAMGSNDQHIHQDAICYQWFKQRLILSILYT